MKAHFERQATYCSAFGADLTARLLRHLPDCILPSSALGQRIANWPGDAAPEADNLPLRLAGGLHALLLSAKAPELAPIYRSGAMADAELPKLLRAVLQRHDAELAAFIANAPQTNEVRRAAGLIATAHWLKAHTGCDLIASELGASAGLNLIFDRFHLALGDGYGPPNSPVQLNPTWQGSLPPAAPYLLRDAQGCDLAPLDLRQRQDLLRLHAYIWADQPERRARTDAAISLNPPLPKKSSAIEFLRQRLASPWSGCHLIYSTVAWQYFSKDEKSQITELITKRGAKSQAPLAWLRIEAHGKSPGAGMRLDLWPEQKRIDLGRMDFHGRWITWTAPKPRA